MMCLCVLWHKHRPTKSENQVKLKSACFAHTLVLANRCSSIKSGQWRPGCKIVGRMDQMLLALEGPQGRGERVGNYNLCKGFASGCLT